jgi:hypothetical protein
MTPTTAADPLLASKTSFSQPNPEKPIAYHQRMSQLDRPELFPARDTPGPGIYEQRSVFNGGEKGFTSSTYG